MQESRIMADPRAANVKSRILAFGCCSEVQGVKPSDSCYARIIYVSAKSWLGVKIAILMLVFTFEVGFLIRPGGRPIWSAKNMAHAAVVNRKRYLNLGAAPTHYVHAALK